MTLRLHIASEYVIDLDDSVSDDEAHAIAGAVTAEWGHLPAGLIATATAPHITATCRMRQGADPERGWVS